MASWNSSVGLTFFETMDYLASNWLLTLGGLMIAIFAGWVMPKRIAERELEGSGVVVITVWLLLIRLIAPLLVIVVLAQKVGILEIDEILFMLSR